MNKSGIIASALLFSVLSVTNPASAEPQGGTVRSGGATINQTLGTTTIQQLTDKAIIDWQRFNVNANELVRFIQPSEMAVVLNRVTGGDPSLIMGKLQANGQLFLVNPNGILFGPNSRVDVGSLVATTLSISDQDFLSGNYNFVQDPSFNLASVINQGTIRVSDEGYVVLTAPLVSNEGMIVANLGKVALGAGNEMTINLDGRNLVNFQLGATPSEDGTVVLTPDAVSNVLGQVVQNGDLVSAGQIVEENGQVHLVGAEGVLVQAGTIRTGSGGEIELDSTRSTVLNEGSVTSARGDVGGNIQVWGQNVTVAGRVDASGLNGGGTIMVGGNLSGQGPDKNAETTNVSGLVVANATESGDGGTIIVWSDERTDMTGGLVATATNGSGGFIETSSADVLAVTGDVRLGEGGEWLLDPANINIVSGAGSDNNISVAAINAALDAGTSVTINAETPSSTVGTVTDEGAVDGNIHLQSGADIIKSGGTATLLTLTAGTAAGSITLDGNITSAGGTLDVTLNPGTTGTVAGNGTIDLSSDNGSLTVNGGAGYTQTGAVSLGTGVLAVNGTTGAVNIADLNGASAVNITNPGSVTMSGTQDFDDLTITGATGTVTFSGDHTTDNATVSTSGDINVTGEIVAGVGQPVAMTSSAGNITVNLIDNFSGGAVTLTATAGSINESGDDPGADILGTTISLTAGTGIGDLGPLEVDGGGLTANSTSGNISIAGINALTTNGISTTGDVTISAGGNLVAGGTTSGNDITLTNAGGVSLLVNDVVAAGNVVITSANSIDELTNSTATDVTAAGTVTLSAVSGIGGTDALDVDATSVSANVSGAGNMLLRSPDDLTITSASTNDGNLELAAAGGGVTISGAVTAGGTGDVYILANAAVTADAAVTAEGNLIDLAAEGDIGGTGTFTSADLSAFSNTGDIEINTDVDDLAALASAGSITVHEADGLTVDSVLLLDGVDAVGAGETATVEVATGNLTLTETVTAETVVLLVPNGTITGAGGNSGIGTVSDNLALQVASGALNLTTDLTTIAVDAGTGSITINESDATSTDGLTVGTVGSVSGLTADGAISVSTALGDLTLDGADVTSDTSVSLTATAGGIGGGQVSTPDLTFSAGTTALINTAVAAVSGTAGGHISLSDADGFQVGGAITSTGGNVTLAANGVNSIDVANAVTADGIAVLFAGDDVTGSGLITADGVSVEAGGDIDVQTSTDDFAAIGDDVTVTEANGLSVGNTVGSVTGITAGTGAAADGDASVTVTTGNLTIVGVGVTAENDLVTLNVPAGTVSGTGGTSTLGTSSLDFAIRQNGAITLNGTDLRTLAAEALTGDISVTEADTTTMDGLTIGTLGSLAGLAADNITVDTAGALSLDASLINGITADNAATLNAADGIAGLGVISAVTLEVTAGDSIDIVTEVGQLAAETTDGNIDVLQEGNLEIIAVGATDGVVAGMSGDVILAVNNGDLTLTDAVVASGDLVTLLVPDGMIINNTGGNSGVEATDLAIEVADGIGSMGSPLVVDVTNLAIDAGTGDIWVEEADTVTMDGLTIADLIVVDGLTADGLINVNVLDNDLNVAADVAAGTTATLNAVNGNVLSTGGTITGTGLRVTASDDIDVDFGTGNVAAQTTDGSIAITTSGNLTVDTVDGLQGIVAGGDNDVTLTSTGGDIVLNETVDAANDLVALLAVNGNVLSTGGSITGADLRVSASEDIDVEFGTGNVAAETVDGSIAITASGNLTVDTVDGLPGIVAGGDNDVTLTSTGGDIILNETVDAANDLVALLAPAGTITNNTGNATNLGVVATDLAVQVANGIGAMGSPVEVQVENLAVDGGTGDIFVFSNGNVAIADLAGLGGLVTTADVVLEVDGDLQLASGAITADQTTLDVNGDVGGTGLINGTRLVLADITGDVNVLTNVQNVQGAADGTISIDSAAPLTVDGNLTSNLEDVNLLAAGDLTLSAPVSGSAVSLSTTGGGHITDTVTDSVQASSLTLSGSGNVDLEVDVDNLNGLADGHLIVVDSDELTVNAALEAGQDVQLLSNGNLTLDAVVEVGAANTVFLATVGGDVTGSANPAVDGGTLDLDVDGTVTLSTSVDIVEGSAVEITLSNTGFLEVGSEGLTATAGNVNLTGTDSLDIGGTVSGGDVNLSFAGSVGGGIGTDIVGSALSLDVGQDVNLETAVDTLTGLAGSDLIVEDVDSLTVIDPGLDVSGDVSLTAGGVGDLVIDGLIDSTGDVSLSAGNDILGAADPHVVGDNLSFNAGGSVALGTDVNGLEGTAADDIDVTDADGLTVTSGGLISTAGDVTLTTGTGGGLDIEGTIEGTVVDLVADGDILGTVDPDVVADTLTFSSAGEVDLFTDVDNLSGTAAGDVFLLDTGASVTVTGAGITSTGGDVDLAAGGLTLDGTVTAFGDVFLEGDEIGGAAALHVDGGHLTFTSDDSVDLVTDIDSVEGTAADNVTIDNLGALTVNGSGVTGTAGDVSLTAGGAGALVTDATVTAGDAVTLTAGGDIGGLAATDVAGASLVATSGGAVDLATDVDELSGTANGNFSVSNAGTLSIAALGVASTTGDTSLEATGDLTFAGNVSGGVVELVVTGNVVGGVVPDVTATNLILDVGGTTTLSTDLDSLEGVGVGAIAITNDGDLTVTANNLESADDISLTSTTGAIILDGTVEAVLSDVTLAAEGVIGGAATTHVIGDSLSFSSNTGFVGLTTDVGTISGTAGDFIFVVEADDLIVGAAGLSSGNAIQLAAGYTAAGSLTLDGLVSTTGDVELLADGDITSALGTAVEANLLDFSSAGAVTLNTDVNTVEGSATNDITLSNAGGLAIGVEMVQSTSGDVSLSAAGNLMLDNLVSGDDVTLVTTAGGAITGSANPAVDATTLTFTSAAGVDLDTDVDTVAGSAAGDIVLDEADGLTVGAGNLQAVGGNDVTLTTGGTGDLVLEGDLSGVIVALTTGGAVLESVDDANADITATSLSLTTATGVGTGANAVEIDATMLSSATASGTGGLFITDTSGGLAVTTASTQNGDIAITVAGGGGNLTVANASTATAGDITLSGNKAITAVSVNAAGDATVSNTSGNVNVTVINAGGDILVERSGSGSSTVAVANATAGGDLSVLRTAGAGAITVGTATAGGDVTLSRNSGTGNVNVNNVTAGDALVVSTNDGSILETGSDAGADLSGATIALTASAGIGTGVNALEVQGDSLSAAVTAAGLVNLADTLGGLTVTSATTVSGAITIVAAGGDLDAQTVSAGGAADVNLSTTTSGNVLLGDVSAAGGTATVTAAGAIEESGSDAGVDLTAATATLTAVSGIGADGPIEIDVDNLTASVSGTGNLALTEVTGDFTIAGNVTVADGDIALEAAAGNLIIDSTIAANNVDLTASGSIGGSANPHVETGALTVDAGTTVTLSTEADSVSGAAGGTIEIVDADDLTVAAEGLTSTGGNVDLVSTAGSLVLDGAVAGVDAALVAFDDISGDGLVSAGDLEVVAGGSIALSTNVDTLAAATTDGDISIDEADTLAIDAVGLTVGVTAGGTGDAFISVEDGDLTLNEAVDATDDLVALLVPMGTVINNTGDNGTSGLGTVSDHFVLQVATGIGTMASPLETDLTSLAIAGGTGDVYVHELDTTSADGLTLGALGEIEGVTATGVVSIVVDTGNLVTDEGVSGGDVYLEATAGDISGAADPDVTATNFSFMSGGEVDLQTVVSTITGTATGDVTIVNVPTLEVVAPGVTSTTGGVSLSVTMGDLILNGAVSGDPVSLSASGTISGPGPINTPDLVINTPGNFVISGNFNTVTGMAGGSINLTDTAGGLQVLAGGLTAGTTMLLDVTGDLDLDGTLTAMTITLSTTGGSVGGGATTHVDGGELILGVDGTVDLATSVDSLAGTAAGDITVANDTDLTVDGLTSTTGSIDLTATGGLTIDDTVSGADVSLTAGGDIGGAAVPHVQAGNLDFSASGNVNLDTEVDSVSGSAASVTITDADGVTVANLGATTVSVTAGGTGDLTVGAGGVSGDTVQLSTTDGDVLVDNALTADVVELTAGGTGDIALNASFTAESVDLDAGGDIGGTGTLTGETVSFSAGGTVGLSTDAEVVSGTAGGDIAITNMSTLSVGEGITSTAGDVFLETTAGGIELTGDVSGDEIDLVASDMISGSGVVTGSSLSFSAGGAVTLATEVDQLAGETTTGDITLTNEGNLEVTTVNSIVGLTSGGTGGTVTVTVNNGDLTNTEAVTAVDGTVALLVPDGTVNGNGGTSGLNTESDHFALRVNDVDLDLDVDLDSLAVDAGTGDVLILDSTGDLAIASIAGVTGVTGDLIEVIALGGDLQVDATVTGTEVGLLVDGDIGGAAATHVVATSFAVDALGDVTLTTDVDDFCGTTGGSLTLSNLGALEIRAGDGVTSGGAINLTAGGNLAIEDTLVAGDAVSLTTTGGGTIGGAATTHVEADALVLDADGAVDLDTDVDSVEGDVNGSVTLDNAGALTVAAGSLAATDNVTVTTAADGLTLTGSLAAGETGQVVLNAATHIDGAGIIAGQDLDLTAGTFINVSTQVDTVEGVAGDGLLAVSNVGALTVTAGGLTAAGGGEDINLAAGGNLTLSGLVSADDEVFLSTTGGGDITDTVGDSVSAAALVANAQGNVDLDTDVDSVAGSAAGSFAVVNAGQLTVAATGIMATSVDLTTEAGDIVLAGDIDATGDGSSELNAFAGINGAGVFSGDTLDFTAGGAVSLSTAVANVTGQTTNGGITLVNAGGFAADVSTIDANIALTATGGTLEAGTVNAGTGTVNLTSTGSGDVTVQNVTGSTVTIDSAGSVTENGSDVDADVTAGTVVVNAVTGIDLDVDTGTLTADNSGTGDVNVSRTTAGTLSVTSASAADGDVTLATTDGQLNVTSASGGNVNLTAAGATGRVLAGLVTADDTITIDAGLNINELGSDPDADLVASHIDLTAVTGIAGVELDADTFTAAVTGTGNINLSGVDSITVESATTNSGGVTLRALNGGDLSVTSAAATNGQLRLSTTGGGDVLVDSASSTGAVVVTSSGAILETDADADADLTGLSVRLDSQTGIGTSGDAFEVSANTGTFLAQATGDINARDTDGGIGITNAQTADGNITLEATNGFLNANRVVANGSGRDISLTASGDVAASNVVALDDAVTIVSGAQITEGGEDTDVDITATDLTMTAVNRIGGAPTLELAVTNLTAAVSGTGQINVEDAGGTLNVLNASTAAGSIVIGAHGNLSITSLTAGGPTSTVTVYTLTAGNVLVDNVAAGGTISITSVGSINELNNDGAADISNVTGTISLTAGSGIGNTGTLEIDGGFLTAVVSGTGRIDLLDTGGTTLQVTDTSTNNGAITIAATNQAIRANSITAAGSTGNVTLTATGAAGDIRVDSITAQRGVFLNAGRDITELATDPATDITAGTASSFVAGGTIGVVGAGGPLELNIGLTGQSVMLTVQAGGQAGGASINLAGTLNGLMSPSGNLTQLVPAPGSALFNGNPIP